MNWFSEFNSLGRSMWTTLRHLWQKTHTISYPETKRSLPKRWRGRIVLTHDAKGEERCVACYLCSAVCPTHCIEIQASERHNQRRYAKTFTIDFSRCVFCGFCEEACPTLAIQLTPDFEMCAAKHESLIYAKDKLLVDGCGKHPDYDFYQHSGKQLETNEDKIQQDQPINIRSNLP